MITIKQIEIRGFRSIRHATLNDLGDFSVLAGLNNSGKSNFLRALNLFFTGRPEPDVPFNLSRDFYRGQILRRQRKAIVISVRFTLVDGFKFKKALTSVETLLTRDFTIRKEWGVKQIEPYYFLNDGSEPLLPNDVDKVNQFLNLISFRYIPNRVVPTDIIRREHQGLRDVLVRRLARYRKQSEEVFGQLQQTAATLLTGVADDIRRFAPDVSNVKLATAASLADLAFQFGYRLQEGAAEMDETEQGSGIQSLLMFETLHLIDRDYFQQFGWKQAALWAVEEPESSLNAALEARTAHFLARVASEPRGRLQIIGTTHSDYMIQYAHRGYFVKKESSESRPLESTATQMEVRKLLDETSKYGVSRWVDPILHYPLEPIVVVEGKYDAEFLKQCFRLVGLHPPLRFICLEDVKQDRTQGGVDRLLSYVKEHVETIRSRYSYAKIIVLLDWDSAAKRSSFERLFSSTDPFYCVAWDHAQANPWLGKSFRGVERFFPNRLIDEYDSQHPGVLSKTSTNVWNVSSDDLREVKVWLNKEVAKGLSKGDEVHAHAMIVKLHQLAY